MRSVYVVDPQKQDAKSRTLSRISVEEQSVFQLLSKVRELISRLDYAVGGAPSGIDRMLTEHCRRALSELGGAQECLRSAAGEVSSLDPGEWVPKEAAGEGTA